VSPTMETAITVNLFHSMGGKQNFMRRSSNRQHRRRLADASPFNLPRILHESKNPEQIV
jgi:hypothetical protein